MILRRPSLKQATRSVFGSLRDMGVSVFSGLRGPRRGPCPTRLRSGDQVVTGALRVRGVLEDRTLIRPKDTQPVVQVGSIHLKRMRREAERLTQKHRGQFCNDLLARV